VADVRVTVVSEYVLDLELVRPILESVGLDPNHVSCLALTPSHWSAVTVVLDDQGHPTVVDNSVAEQTVTGRVSS
jgi:hypothetical protein